jgi:cell division protein FtsN
MPSPQYNPRRQNREAPKKNKRSGASPRGGLARVQIPWWLWIIVGAAIGIFASFLTRLAHTQQTDATTISAEKNSDKTQKSGALIKADAKKGDEKKADEKVQAGATDIVVKPDETKTVTKFDFYTLLPEREVIVPNEREAIKSVEKPKPVAGQEQAAPEQLFLQVGSFRSAQEAERRRAQIKTLGLEAKVEEVIANSDTWYRVQAGPFVSREQLSKARDQLSAAGIESLLLRQKQG